MHYCWSIAKGLQSLGHEAYVYHMGGGNRSNIPDRVSADLRILPNDITEIPEFLDGKDVVVLGVPWNDSENSLHMCTNIIKRASEPGRKIIAVVYGYKDFRYPLGQLVLNCEIRDLVFIEQKFCSTFLNKYTGRNAVIILNPYVPEVSDENLISLMAEKEYKLVSISRISSEKMYDWLVPVIGKLPCPVEFWADEKAQTYIYFGLMKPFNWDIKPYFKGGYKDVGPILRSAMFGWALMKKNMKVLKSNEMSGGYAEYSTLQFWDYGVVPIVTEDWAKIEGSELIGTGDNKNCIAVRTLDDIADFIYSTHGNADLYSQIIANGRATMLEKHNVVKAAETFLNLVK